MPVHPCPQVKMNASTPQLHWELKAAFLGLGTALLVLGTTLGFSLLMQERQANGIPAAPPQSLGQSMSNAPSLGQQPSGKISQSSQRDQSEKGRHLFALNCAHCHGDDATGDEGPDLHNVRKSDARIAAIIQKGIKGEMPKFGQKFKEEDVQALIAFLRTLKK